MAAGGEDLKAQAWVHAQLAGSGALTALVPANRIVADVAPSSMPRPHVIHFLRAPIPDVRGVGPARIMVELEFVAEGVTDDSHSLETLLTVEEAIDAALHGNLNSETSDLVVLACWRTEPWVPPVEIDPDGTRIYRRGGNYRITCRAK